MNMPRWKPLKLTLYSAIGLLAAFVAINAAAASITKVGAVNALTDVAQLQGVLGIDDFDAILYFNWTGTDGLPKPVFPGPLSGGGVQEGNFALLAGVATFNEVVTQFGLTAGKSGRYSFS